MKKTDTAHAFVDVDNLIRTMLSAAIETPGAVTRIAVETRGRANDCEVYVLNGCPQLQAAFRAVFALDEPEPGDLRKESGDVEVTAKERL